MKTAIQIFSGVLLGLLLSYAFWNTPPALAARAAKCPNPPEECHGFPTQKTTRLAWEAQEKAEGDCLGASCYGIDGNFVRSERWANYVSYIPWLPRTQDIVRVELSKTTDTGADVVRITDSEGRVASFWLTGHGDVGSVTTY